MAGFTVAPRDLRRAMALIQMAVERRNTIPVLGTIRMEWGGTALRLRATDLDVEVSVTVEAECTGTGRAQVNPARLIWASGGDPVDPLRFSVEDRGGDGRFMRIDSGPYAITFRLIIPPEDWPEMKPVAEDAARAEVSQADLRRLFARSRWSISTEATRYYLNGTFLTQRPGGTTLRAVSTDGHRLAMIDSGIPWPAVSAIVPTVAVRIACAALSPAANEPVALRIAPTQCMMEIVAPSWSLRSKLIDGTYPDYTRVIPQNPETAHFVVNRAGTKRLVSAAGRGDGVTVMAFDIETRVMRMKMASLDEGVELTGPLECGTAEGQEPFAIGFNRRYIDTLLQMTGAARFALTRPNDPARVTTEEPDETFIIMPMRI